VLVLFPTIWDRKQLAACEMAWRERVAVDFASPTDEDCPARLDVLELIAALARERRGRLDGVMSSSDYPGAVAAAALAESLGLPGARPESVLRASHKWAARVAQAECVPEAVPPFALVDPELPHAPLRWVVPGEDAGGTALGAADFPCFLKPVKGSFSMHARVVRDAGDLAACLEDPALHEYALGYLGIFETLRRRFGPELPAARHFVAEGLMRGDQVTVEGWSFRGEVEILGIVDSVMHPGTQSFAGFEYPSRHPAALQARMADTACRLVRHLGLDNTMFNVELMYDPATGRLGIVEVNPRMCGQFADLYAKVDGTNGYEVMLALALGERPSIRRAAGPYAVAASYPLRIFEPARVERAPTAEDVRAAEALFPGTLVWIECETGQLLTDFRSIEDGSSIRYAVVNLGAPDRAALEVRLDAVRGVLGFAFVPVPTAPTRHLLPMAPPSRLESGSSGRRGFRAQRARSPRRESCPPGSSPGSRGNRS
jgi:hypothetical protein